MPYKMLFSITLLALATCSLLLLTSCSSMKAVDFEDKQPPLVPEEFFIGTFEGDGLFFDRSQRVRRAFNMKLKGYMQGDILILDELLTYDDGESLTRIYEIEKVNDNKYIARTEAVVGEAEIEAYGNVLNWRYTLKQPIGEKVWELNFNDWMFRVNDDTILNRAYVSKFGLEVGQVLMTLRRISDTE